MLGHLLYSKQLGLEPKSPAARYVPRRITIHWLSRLLALVGAGRIPTAMDK